MNYDECNKLCNNGVYVGVRVYTEACMDVTGCMCGSVSCLAADKGAKIEKKQQHSFKTPTIQRHWLHNPPTQQTSSLHCGFMCVFKPKVQV